MNDEKMLVKRFNSYAIIFKAAAIIAVHKLIKQLIYLKEIGNKKAYVYDLHLTFTLSDSHYKIKN